MYFVECSEDAIETKKEPNRKQPLTKIIYAFIGTGFKCARLEDMNYKNIDTAYKSFVNTIWKEKLSHIKVIMRNDNLYLVNTLIK